MKRPAQIKTTVNMLGKPDAGEPHEFGVQIFILTKVVDNLLNQNLDVMIRFVYIRRD